MRGPGRDGGDQQGWRAHPSAWEDAPTVIIVLQERATELIVHHCWEQWTYESRRW